jgi:hypothetical protein
MHPMIQLQATASSSVDVSASTSYSLQFADPRTTAGAAIRRIVEDVEGLQGKIFMRMAVFESIGGGRFDGMELANVLHLAQEEATLMGAASAEPHHILLALAGEFNGPTGANLREYGAGPGPLLQAIKAVLAEDNP